MLRVRIDDPAAFEPEALHAMSEALEDVCNELGIDSRNVQAREAVAVRLIRLASNGVLDPAALREHLLLEMRREIADVRHSPRRADRVDAASPYAHSTPPAGLLDLLPPAARLALVRRMERVPLQRGRGLLRIRNPEKLERLSCGCHRAIRSAHQSLHHAFDRRTSLGLPDSAVP